MGSFSKPPYPGQRPGSVKPKIIKEIDRGRKRRNSTQKFYVTQGKNILDDLQERILKEPNPNKKEPLYREFTNRATSFPSEVFVPSEIKGIVKYSDLADNELLSNLSQNSYQGQRPDFLPLHYLVKLLCKRVPENGNNRYVYLLGNTSTSTPTEVPIRNLRGLEYFLLTFAQRMSGGQCLDVEVDGGRVQVPLHNESFSQDNFDIVKALRHRLHGVDVPPSDHYALRIIKDGNQKVHTTLHIIGEQRAYRAEKGPKTVAVSYLTIRHQ